MINSKFESQIMLTQVAQVHVTKRYNKDDQMNDITQKNRTTVIDGKYRRLCG
jgi:hypothetical protein